MQTQASNNPDGKGPSAEAAAQPAERDANPHEPRKRVLQQGDENRLDVHGGAVNREDGSVVEAAEGEIKSTPQGP